ncbi:MAG TPA: SulP family inorganic anion transporter [Albitalea sp.]|uniref:SulP family inorganic anion transporter n=1 Tax=Piscinibacter sp. TaxID=1903157 RepID=UPI002ED47992
MTPPRIDLSRWRAWARDALQDDFVAACIVAVLLIPQSLAYALLAGLPPQAGLYASLLPLVAYAALGSSPAMGVGPVALLSLMISQALAGAPAGVPASAVALVLAIEVGLMLALAAWWRLDALAALLSVPVLQGFETGAALSIALSQLPVLLGASAGGSSLPQVLQSWWQAATPWWPLTALYGLAALTALWLARRHTARWLQRHMRPEPAKLLERLAPLAVLMLAIGVSAFTGAGARGVELVGALPALHWTLAWPTLDLTLWRQLLPSAAPIALVTFVSSLVVAESLARRDGHRIEPRRELAGLAAANLAAGLSAGMPVAGSFTRSIVNLDAGARTRMAGVFTAALMALAIWLLGKPLALLPTAVLAATILVAVASVFDAAPFREAWRYSRSEGALMAVVAALTVVMGVGWALAVGVAGSIALLLQRTARPHVALIGRVPGTEHYRNVGRHEVQLTPGVVALRIDESLLFTNARQLADVVQQHVAGHPGTRRVVLLMSPVNRIDFSGLTALRALHELLHDRGIRLDLSEVKGPVLDGLNEGGWTAWFDGRLFLSHHQAMLDER